MKDSMEPVVANARSISDARRTTHELVLELMRDKILAGELPSGSRLVQSDLAEMMEVSTTPVREALRDLASEGLVRFDPHRGAVVQELSLLEFKEIYEVRMLLEPMAIRKAVERVTPEHLERLERLHQLMLEETSPARWVQFNREFHMGIYETSLSPRIAGIIRTLQDASVMYVGVALEAPSLLSEANEGHGAILTAIQNRDPEAAAEATLGHLRSSMNAFDSVLG
ncbi:MAG TPA: GntR family transcriptional regulator [Acidimicrobiia bacterium]|nr:GntR family transcriptional regulator [Acidimicrobiia bacterium]